MVAVVLYHAGISVVGGGFIGVDVFFVISGYLITQIIVDEIERGTFTIVGFYERRVRRIFPALFVVVLVTSVVVCFLLLPVDLRTFGQSVVAVTVFVSNAFFWWKSGYFDGGALEKPMLHTWSLAVEEQFYIVFPVYLLFIHRRFRGRNLAFTWIAVVASFALSVWGVTRYQQATFYLAPTRAWELGLGALLAMGAVPACRAGWQRSVLTIVGLALVVYGAVAFSSHTAFPGPSALIPCLGSAFILHAGASGSSAVGRLLGLRPIVFIGLISYSLYLWHWPILSFARLYGLETLTPLQVVALLTMAVAISIASWRYVERPVRVRQWPRSRRQLFATAALVMASTATVGAALVLTRGMPRRFGPELATLIAETSDTSLQDDPCNNKPVSAVRDGGLCRIGADGDAPVSFLVWGDSMADAAAPVIGEVAAREGVAGLRATRDSCPPLLGVDREGADGEDCHAFNDEVERQLEMRSEIHTVILVSRWAKNAEGVPYKGDPSDAPAYLTDALSPDPSLTADHAVFSRGLERTLAALDRLHKRVWIVSAPPEVGVGVPYVLARGVLHHQIVEIAPTRAEYRRRQSFVFVTFHRLHREHPFQVLHPENVFCDESKCDIIRSGHPLYHDAVHPSRFGEHLFAPMFDRMFSHRHA